MVRPEWGLIGFATSAALALAILSPFIPYGISLFAGGFPISIDLYLATAISGVIATALTIIFYKLAIDSAEELLAKAEV